ncbi:MAG: polysaccharide deacetylase family protein [Firmicutes bacterium]|nr:polysaccharide deacetylase family protein [Bacillota bacterium]
MAETMFKTLAFFFSVYALIPTALARLFHVGAKSRARGVPGRVAITFDDGPDPRYTPQVLNILKEYNAKACFFVLGRKAKAHPELVARIHAEGHEVASHGYNHHFSWLLGPRGMKREIEMTSSLITTITGQPPALYRPPWGLFNLYSFFVGLLHKQEVVLWSFMSWDWGRRCTAEAIVKKVLSRVKDGAILVFHDGDGVPFSAPGAPQKMLSALPGILSELKKRNLKITPLKELLKKRPEKKIRPLFRLWDKAIRRLLRIEDVVAGGRPTMFRIALRKYRGKTRVLPDGTVLRRGDFIGELHVNNEFIQNISASLGEADPARLVFSAKKTARQSLAALAGWLKENPRYAKVKAVVGLSILHRGSQSLGFTPFEISPLLSLPVFWYESMYLAAYHPAGKARLAGHRQKLRPKLVAMSKEELFRRYLEIDKNTMENKA